MVPEMSVPATDRGRTGGEQYTADSSQKEAQLGCANCLLKDVMEGNIEDGKSWKKL